MKHKLPCFFNHISKLQEDSWKCHAQRSIFDELRLLWSCGETLSFDISSQMKPKLVIKQRDERDTVSCYTCALHTISQLICIHSRPQRPRSFWSAPRIATSGLVQRHSVFEWLCKHNRLRPEPIRFVKLDSEHAQSDGKSVNRGLPVLDSARGRDSWCWPKGARPLGTRMICIYHWYAINNVFNQMW